MARWTSDGRAPSDPFCPLVLSSPGGILNLKIIKEKHSEGSEGSHLSPGVHHPARERLGQPPSQVQRKRGAAAELAGWRRGFPGIAGPGAAERILEGFGGGGCSPLFTPSQSELAHFLAANLPAPRALPEPTLRVPITSPAFPAAAVGGGGENWVTLQVPPPARAPGECVLTSCCVRAGAESPLQLRGAGVS